MRPDRLFFVAILLLVPVLGVPAQELTERATFKGYKYRVDRAALSPDGKILAVGDEDKRGDRRAGGLKLWDAVAGKEIVSLPADWDPFASLAFSADGKRLASGGNRRLQVWDVNAHKEVAFLQDSADVIALNRDGTRLAAVGGKQCRIWEVGTGKELASFRYHVPVSGPMGIAFSRDLATLATRNYQEIDLWDTATGKEKATLSEHRGEVGCMVWSVEEKTLIASSCRYEGKGDKWKGDVKLWDVASGKERATLPGPFGCIREMAVSPDGKTLALLDWPELREETDLKLVDVATGRQRVLSVPPGYSFLAPRFTTEGKLLVTGASADGLRLWEVSLPKKDGKP